MRSRSREIKRLNLARLQLPSLRLVVLCAELGSLSAAATAAHMSVTGASHKLASMEEALGVELFARGRRGVRATGAGQIVASHARQMLATADALLEALVRVHSTASENPSDGVADGTLGSGCHLAK